MDQQTPTTATADPFVEGLKSRWLSLVERYIAQNLPRWVAAHGETRAKAILAGFVSRLKSPGYWNDVLQFIETHKLEVARHYDPVSVSPQAIAELNSFIESKHADAFR
jgi:hypothetical protein